MAEAQSDDYSAWVGRSEENRDTVTAGPLDRLAATLDRDDPRAGDGDAIPPLAHWLFFLPDIRQSEIGPDGHPKRGGFLPPVHELPRRMWAGSRIAFPGEIRVGDSIVRRSTIQSVQRKDGASGPLVFVTVRHEIGREGDAAAIVDEHDIVYRGLEAPAVKASPKKAEPGQWRRELVPDAVQLFRYSALTFNGHRIHYDQPYVTGTEGYPGLIVHGPLLGMLQMELARRSNIGRVPASFEFRALSPIFAGTPLTVGARKEGDGSVTTWIANDKGGLAQQGKAVFK